MSTPCCGDLNVTITNDGDTYTLMVNGVPYTAQADCNAQSVTFTDVDINGCAGDIVVDGNSFSPCCGSSIGSQSGLSHSGSSTSVSSSGGGGVSTICCPGVLVPTTLYITTEDQGGCPCITGSWALKWVEGMTWQSDTITLCGSTGYWIFYCSNIAGQNAFTLAWSADTGLVETTLPQSCSPFLWTVGLASIPPCSNGDFKVTITQ